MISSVRVDLLYGYQFNLHYFSNNDIFNVTLISNIYIGNKWDILHYKKVTRILVFYHYEVVLQS